MRYNNFKVKVDVQLTKENRLKREVNAAVPLVVDLDGTLTPIDTLHEAIIRFLLSKHVIAIFCMCLWLMRGKAHFKNKMALVFKLDASLIPWNEDVLDYIRDQKEAGRPIYLCTASNQSVANKICEHFVEFDAAFGSDDTTNLSGTNKRNFLDRTFGKGSYEYIGNSFVDLPIWQHSQFAVVKSNNKRLLSKVKATGVPMFHMTVNVNFKTNTMKQLRIHQWVKNFLVFVPLLAAHEYSDIEKVSSTITAFLCFGLVASGTYIINDIVDMDADRSHPEKKYRPISAGSLPIIYGLFASFILLVAAVSISFVVSLNFAFAIIAYFIFTLIYSLYLKTIVILDIISLSLLFTLRIIAGTAACALMISPWLLIFSFFIFLSLAAMKRYIELNKMNATFQYDRRGYDVDDKLLVMVIGLCCAYTSVAIFSIYLLSDAAQKFYSGAFPITLSIPILVYWLTHMWMSAIKYKLHHDPIVVAIKDKTSWISALLFLAVFVMS